jgi:hypothetical protein
MLVSGLADIALRTGVPASQHSAARRVPAPFRNTLPRRERTRFCWNLSSSKPASKSEAGGPPVAIASAPKAGASVHAGLKKKARESAAFRR